MVGSRQKAAGCPKNTDLPAGICFGWENFGRHETVAMGRHEAVAMGRQTDLVLDASLPKHNNFRPHEAAQL